MAGSLVSRVGQAASAAAATCSIVYVVGQLLEWLGLLGSSGGPNASSTALGIAILLLPSLLLGSANLVMMAALHEAAPQPVRVISLSALGFAIAYAVLTGLVYFVQLTFVAPRIASGASEGIEILLFVPYRSFLFAVDLFGYSLMCLSALFVAFALPQTPATFWARRCFQLTGALFPALALQMYFPWLIWIGAIWAISYPLACIQSYRLFGQLD